MSALYRTTHYGYSLVKVLTCSGTREMKEGTIYPILARLAKDGLVRSEWVESNQGPPRKYYKLTTAGHSMFEALNAEFERLVQLVGAAGQSAAQDMTADESMKPIIIGKPKP